MKNVWKKAAAATLAAAMCLSTYSVMPEYRTNALELGTYEAEDLEPTNVWTDIYGQQFPGYSGTGFVYHTSTTITMEIEAPEAGMYEISCRYVQILDEGGRDSTVCVNGSNYLKKFPYTSEWSDYVLGNFRLNEGTNVIEFKPQYGYVAYDTITVKAAELPELVGNATPCDPDATPETKALMSYLASVYGEHIISGQQEIYGGGSSMHQSTISLTLNTAAGNLTDSAGNIYTYDEADLSTADDGSTFVWKCYDENGKKYEYDSQNRSYRNTNYDLEFEYLQDLTGDTAAIRGFDVMNYNPLYGWDDGTTERLIDWVTNKNGIATVCWHLNVPTDFASYELGEPVDWSAASYKNNSSFSVANAVVDGTKENEFLDLCIEDVAEQLLRAQEAGAPILFRPFHEAEGNGGVNGEGAWFWWAQEGAEPYKALWKYLYTELTEKYDLHNLIWVQNLYNWSPESALWYVGDEYVDIVGLDKYNTQYNRHDGLTSGPNLDAESGIFYDLYSYVDGEKMVAMPENSTVPSLDNMMIEKAGWLYYCTWYDNGQDNFISGENYQNAEELTKLMQSEYCITLSELPEDLYGTILDAPDEPDTQDDTTESENSGNQDTTETTSGEGDHMILCGDVDCNGTINIVDVITLCQSTMGVDDLANYGADAAIAADANQDGAINGNDAMTIMQHLVRLIEELPVVYAD